MNRTGAEVLASILEQAGIDPGPRAETVSPAQYASLAAVLAQSSDKETDTDSREGGG